MRNGYRQITLRKASAILRLSPRVVKKRAAHLNLLHKNKRGERTVFFTYFIEEKDLKKLEETNQIVR